MQEEQFVQVGIEKIVVFFGIVITFLTGVIAFFLKRHLQSTDEILKEFRDTVNNHESRITVLETESEIFKKR